MLNIITEILVLIMFVSGVGSFVTLRPAYEIHSKTQKLWMSILLTAIIAALVITLFTAVPDFIHGFIDGISGK
ncbi:hypothetical protein [Leuconostoc mesenteroides]|uniref:hypothetical protein n=1 Tax=Leuconostoc mesenteroides TaxID=1245 RepID=UPI001CBC52DB|nr:hypothetical protein [Leuconostoc mesenteroides]MBZ1525924.1 hypothetical protein [Leuconostoc mesenteroides]